MRMEAFGQEERDIQEEFAKWVAVCFFVFLVYFFRAKGGRSRGEGGGESWKGAKELMREREGWWFRFLLLGQVLRVFGRRRGDINGEFFFISTFFFLEGGGGFYVLAVGEGRGEG